MSLELDSIEDIVYDDLVKWDVVGKLLKPLKKQGWFWDTKTGKFTNISGFDLDSPWISIKRTPNYLCAIYHRVMFDYLEILPSFCMDCWKVVARPKTVEDLIKCFFIMKDIDLPSKLGTAPRKNTFGLYQCYFYNKSLEQAKETEELVIKRFHNEVDDDMLVYTKRFCTEYEVKFGRSDVVTPTEDMLKWEKIVNNLIEYPERLSLQPTYLRRHIIRDWIETASQAGDPTVFRFIRNDGTLSADCVRY
jgi:hypothetical protein